MTDQPTNQLTNQQLDEIEARVNAARHCPNAEANGRRDGQHTLSGSFSHIRCELCTYSRPRGERVEETAVLLAEVRRLRALLPTPVTVPTKDTPLSDYDFVELVAFASKVESEGFGYAYEEYPPHFEAPELAPIADDYSLLRQLFDEWEEALDEFWTRPDAEDVYDAHIDEARRRRREARAAAEPAVEKGR